jgi:hypothetical protein
LIPVGGRGEQSFEKIFVLAVWVVYPPVSLYFLLPSLPSCLPACRIFLDSTTAAMAMSIGAMQAVSATAQVCMVPTTAAKSVQDPCDDSPDRTIGWEIVSHQRDRDS